VALARGPWLKTRGTRARASKNKQKRPRPQDAQAQTRRRDLKLDFAFLLAPVRCSFATPNAASVWNTALAQQHSSTEPANFEVTKTKTNKKDRNRTLVILN
jgi:hypothetical protein